MAEGPNDPLHGNDSAGMTIAHAVQAYEQLSPVKSRLDEDGRLHLSAAIRVLTPAQQFVILSQDMQFSGIHSRLFDAVHAPENPDELLDRLGGFGTNKVAMAMAVEDEAGNWFPTAVVYTYWSDQPNLPEKIKPILSEPLRRLGDEAKVIVPYTISSNFPKAGEMLIANTHAYVYQNAPGAVLSTLSPLRAGNKGFANWLRERGLGEPRDGHELLARVFDYLMPARPGSGGAFRSNDPVQSFHMAGMGAMLAAIRPDNADSPLDFELAHGVMANYVYPEDSGWLEENRRRFVEEGILTVSPELAGMVPGQYQDRLFVEEFMPAGNGSRYTPDDFTP